MIVEQRHIVLSNVSNMRLSEYVLGLFAQYPTKSAVRKAIKRGWIRLDGVTVETSKWVSSGMEIQLVVPEVIFDKNIELDIPIIYEDDHIAVINKPAGIPVSGHQSITIQHALPHLLEVSTCNDKLLIPRPIHRLDKPTSGLLIVGKTYHAMNHLANQFETHQIEKQYHALVCGASKAKGKIESKINQKNAISYFIRIQQIESKLNRTLSLLKVHPITGRKHQIRKHLSSVGLPILGDCQYGSASEMPKVKGLFLVATKISFIHPNTEKNMSLEIPLPKKFKRQLDWEGRLD